MFKDKELREEFKVLLNFLGMKMEKEFFGFDSLNLGCKDRDRVPTNTRNFELFVEKIQKENEEISRKLGMLIDYLGVEEKPYIVETRQIINREGDIAKTNEIKYRYEKRVPYLEQVKQEQKKIKKALKK